MDKPVNIDEIENIVMDGLYRGDIPDLCDAYIVSADWKATGEELTEDEILSIEPEEVQRLALLKIFGI